MSRRNLEKASDPLDLLLARLPEEPVPVDLAARICANVLAHHRRHLVLHFGMSALLVVAGIWLALPGLAGTFQSLALPNSGWPMITAFLEMAGEGAARMVVELISTVSVYQTNLSIPFSGAAWVGIVALAGGCLLALDQMLPRNEM